MATRSYAKKQNVLRKKTRQSGRRLLLQQLERRELLAGDLDAAPRLISVNPNAGEIFDLERDNQLSVSPTELTFRFDGGQRLDPATLSAIRITRSGGDGAFADGNEEIVQPGFLGFGESERIVIARFASPLVDDQYKIEIFGFDQPAAGIVGLRNVENQLFIPEDLEADRQEIFFELEIGALVTAVVPQPIEMVDGVRVQRRDQVHIFFNDDPLSDPAGGAVTTGDAGAPTVVDPRFYQLIATAETVENVDDQVVLPTSITYDPAINRAVLTFESDLSELAPVAATGGAATLRLRIGTSEALPQPPVTLNLPADEAGSGAPGDTFASARQLGALFGSAGQSIVIDSEIAPTEEYLLQWPGANDEPGIRDIRRNSQLLARADTELGIATLYYNFRSEYGNDTQGNRLDNAITPAQRQRVREALDLYEQHLGVRFVETADRGLQFVTGDMRAVEITADIVSGGGLSIFRSDDSDPGTGLLILDGAENFFDGYGFSPDSRPSYFVEALRGVGSLLGIGDTFEQPPGTAAGSEPELSFGIRPEPDFLSQSDITAGQHLFRPEGRDIDLYRFTAGAAGRLTAETFAERLAGSSLLDTSLTLWRRVDGGGPDDFELIARNDDFYSNDSFVGIDLVAGDYVVGVSASGNDSYNPAVEDSGLGGRSEGGYQLRLVFQSANSESIVDTAGTPLDGDADGVGGGTYNFWFRTARPVTSGAPANQPRTIFVDKTGSDSSGSGAIDAPLQTIDEAMQRAQAGDIVRLLPNAGSDNRIDTLSDNRAYEIGRGGVGNLELQDGRHLEVKRGVTVMIDAGSILKLRAAQITTGSSTIDIDRSQSALQVLGTPILVGSDGAALVGSDGGTISGRVIFTSYDDQRVGLDTNPLQTTPSAGQWGGLSFRNDVDYAQGRPVNEAEGIFLNYVGQADIRFGGGTAGGSSPVTPIQMSEARPAIKYNIIRNSADAAISADPDSFEETNFHAPRFQRANVFTSDYGRVGPDLAGNGFINNTINGLFVRIDTPTAGQLEPMTVSGRFDDADITHVLSQVLVLQGTPGGPLLQTTRPDVLSVTVGPSSSTSTLDAGTYDYRLTFVDADGSESLASLPTREITVPDGGAVRLAALPAASGGFVGRRLYRLDPATGEYLFVTQLNRSQASYVDTGVTRGGTLNITGSENYRPRYDARLSVDPGVVVKLQTSRIESMFGADFYAEGADGREVIFTSRQDDRYGAGGTFDTNNDGNSAAGGNPPLPGDWGGLVFGQGSDASIDYALITFGGGNSPADGGFASFNAVEVLQAEARIAHSTFENNAAGEDASIRGGKGFNDASALFVRGAQPIIVENVFRGNAGAAISVNPDALDFSNVTDRGRATGAIDRLEGFQDNQGPLVRLNRLDDNGINGMLVRSEVLTTESVWDDSDIVHVVGGDVVAVDHHYNGGLRLESSPGESLVVKVMSGARLLATGRPLDIDDRIGGTLQIVGQPGFPVVLTSIHDDSVGAGFAADGKSQNDTDGEATAPQPGDWQGIVLDAFANDRNVQITLENEPALSTAAGQNAVPGAAQRIGTLAADQKSGDENERLGFSVHGTLSDNSDVDVYSFLADGGTEVWIDLDRTTYSLDSVVELIDQNGNILVLSDDSFVEGSDPDSIYRNPAMAESTVHSLYKTGDGQSESPNPGDAGFRVVLPGAAGVDNLYYVRVRSSNLGPGDPASNLLAANLVREGRTRGAYRLGIRLREIDEVAGSTVQFADIRYAVNGIDLVSAPLHSPLAGEAAERLFGSGANLGDQNNNNMSVSPALADPLGNLMSTDRAALYVTGEIGNQSISFSPTAIPEEDIDLFRLDLFYDSLETEVFRPDLRFVPLTFDIDYADGLGRVNTSISIYDAAGRLILTGRDSNIAGDVGTPLRGVDAENLTAGSAGVLDAHIGPVELPEGVYYVAVHSDVVMPAPLGQFTNPNSADPLVRMYPVNSVRQIASDNLDDHTVGSTFSFNVQQLDHTADRPILEPAFGADAIVPYTLEDVRLFVALDQGIGGGNERTTVITIDPFTGVFERTLGETGPRVGDLAMRGDGELYSYSIAPQTGPSNNGNVGNYLNISTQTGSVLSSSDDGLVYRRDNENFDGTENDDNAQLIINAMAFNPNDTSAGDGDRMYVVGNRDTSGRLGEVLWNRNIMYSNVATTGAATNRGSTNGDFDRNFGDGPIVEGFGPASNKLELGVIDTGGLPDVDNNDDPILSPGARGNITGMAINPDNMGELYAVDDRGGVYLVNLFAQGRTVDRSPGERPEGDPPPPVSGQYSRVLDTTYLGTIPSHQDHGAFPVRFSGMALGPKTTEGGAYRQTMFATTADGWIYSIGIGNDNNGDPMAVPAPALNAGRSALPIVTVAGTQLNVQPVGLAFSTLEENPWHQTNDRRDNPGHGVYPPYDQSRMRSTLLGGSSLYFGFEPTSNVADNTLEHPENDGRGTLAPGGSHGSVVTQPFSLTEYSSSDKPTVYFSYFLETEGNNYNPGVELQRDSFRVFAAGDDGQWQLLATNDSFRQFERLDEYDYFTTTGIPVQELHDNTGDWRQARVDISPLAGHSQIRIRFDFATAGAVGFGDSGIIRNEIQAVPGAQLADGETLVIETDNGFEVFEIDRGYALQVPSGNEINVGDSVEITFADGTQTVTFTDGPAALGAASISANMTSSQVADAVRSALLPAVGGVRFGESSIGLTGATDVVNNASASGVVVDGERGVQQGRVPIVVEGNLTADQVSQRLAEAFAIGFGNPQATAANFKSYAGRMVLYNYSVFSAGPFGLSRFLPGDEFGDFESPSLERPNPRPGQRNEVEGVYIDDLVIGFAERGEVVINAPQNDFNFIRNPESDPEFEQPERPNEILTGKYALEIRRSAEFGVPDDYDPINLRLNESVSLGRSFDTNDRLDNAVTLVAQPGGQIRDGDFFTLSDGTRSLTFEFDSVVSPGVASGRVPVPFDPRVDDEAVVATAIRDAINSPQVQSGLDIRAESNDSRERGATTSRRVNLFGEHVFVNPSAGRNLKVDLVKEENFRDRVAAETFPQIRVPGGPVNLVLEPDTLARAFPTRYINGATDTLVATGKIGDRAVTGTAGEILGDFPEDDRDIIKIHLFAGNQIDIDVDAATLARGANRLTTPRVTVSGADGSLLGRSDIFGNSTTAPGESVREAFLRFTAPADGYYYVAVDGRGRTFGEYQLIVRPSSNDNDVLYAEYHMDQGDLNRVRHQGQILVASNFISDSAEWGITATAGDRNSPLSQLDGSELPKPGNARLLRNENTSRLVPGSVITNNVIIDGGSGGIEFAGDPSPSGSMQGAVPFGRIVNNTVVGRSTTGDIGIDVGVNASPTVLNNIISGFDTGIRVDGSATSQTTIAGGNIYQDNRAASNFPLGNLSFNLDDASVTQALFTDADNRIFIPATGSLAIDSSFASLPDRQELVNTVKEPSGIGRSPIVAPSIDAYGQPRVDDPLVETPAGVGSNVFIDRGALDRADFVGPLASIAVPTDFVQGRGGATVGGDVDASATFIRLAAGTLEYFEIQLLEPAGSGPNAATVLSEAVVLTENGRRLIAGVDYNFGYSDTSNTIRLTPLSGIWRPDGAYEVTLNNRDRIVVQAPAGDGVSDGDQIIVTDENGTRAFLEFETGFVLDMPLTLTLVVPAGVGGSNGFRDGDQFEITSPSGLTERFELNVFGGVSAGVTEVPVAPGASTTEVRDAILVVLSDRATALDLAPVAVGSRRIHIGSLEGHSVDVLASPLEVTGLDRGVTDGDTLTYHNGNKEVRFEFKLQGDPTTAGDSEVIVPFERTDTHLELAEKLAEAFGDSDLDLPDPRALGDGRVHLGGVIGDIVDASGTAIGQNGMPGVTDSLQMTVAAPGAGGFAEGDQFAIVHNGTTTLFEFSFDRDVEVGAEPIRLTAGEGPAAVAAQVINAIRNASIGLDPIDEGDGRIRLNEPFGYELDLLGFATDPDSAALSASGVPGGALSVAVVPAPSLSPDAVAAQMVAALRQTPLVTQLFTPGGGTIWLAGAEAVEGIETLDVQAMRDLAGNRLQPNRANEETQFTILMPDVRLDYGDAPTSYGTLAADNGARHTLGNRGIPRLGATIDTEDDGQPVASDGADEDGLPTPVDGLFYDVDGSFLGFLNPLDSAVGVSVITTGGGLLDAWIDFNGNGNWNDPGEQVLNSRLVLDGVNRIQISTPADAVEGLTWARFRLSQTGDLAPLGVAVGGEVEDYQLRIAAVELPEPVDDAFSVNEDSALEVTAADSVLNNDELHGATEVVATLEQNVQSGTLTLNEDGTFSYVPRAHFSGVDTFTYSVTGFRQLDPSDSDGGSLPFRSDTVGTVTITVDAVNDPPEFTGTPSFDVLEDGGPFTLAYATDVRPGPAGDADELATQTVRFEIAADADNPAGLLLAPPTIDANGRLQFNTAPDAIGTARFVVTLVDDGGTSKPEDRDTSEPQTLTVNVRPVNDDPRVTASEPAVYSVREDNSPDGGGILIPLRGGDGDPAGLLDQFSVGPPNEAASGPGGSQSLSIVNQDFPLTTSGRGRVEAVTDGAGNVTALRYVPAEDFNNEADGSFDSFFYTVTDDGVSFDPATGSLESDPRTAEFSINVIVEAVNDAPTFTANFTSITRLEDSGANEIEGFATDISAGPPTAIDETDTATGQTVSFEVVPAPGFTAADIAALFASAPAVTSEGTLSFAPAANAVGTIEVLVSAVDDGPANASRGDENRSEPVTLTLSIAPVNDPPVADPSVIFAELDEDHSIDLPVTRADGTGLFDVFRVGPANEADNSPGGNQTLTTNEFLFSSVTAGGGRLEAITVDGQFAGLHYTPARDFNGTDSFVYGVIDDGRSFDLDRGEMVDNFREAYATVSLTIHPVNDRPQFAGAPNVTVPEDVGSDEGIPADQIGRTTIDDWVANMLAGPETAEDEHSGPDSQSLEFEITYTSGVDPSVLFAELPTVDPVTGQLRFRTAADASGQTSFQIVAVDDGPQGFLDDDPTRPEHQFRSLPRTFTIEVTAVNDAPTFTAGGPIAVAEDSGPFSQLWATDVSPGPADEVASGQAVVFDVVVAEEDQSKFSRQPTISDEGVLQFTPADDASGEVEIVVTARDTDGAVAPEPHTLTLTITPVNDAPVAADDTFDSDEDSVLAISAAELLANDIDVDLPDDTLTVTDLATTSQLGASVMISADGSSITYDPTGAANVQALRPGETATDRFTYRVVDLADATSSLATVTMTVAGVNDAPVARPDQISVHPSQSTSFSPLANDTDVDGTLDPESILITTQPTSGTLRVSRDGTFTYTPFERLESNDRVRYAVRDDLGRLSESTEIQLIVNPPPVASADVGLTYRNEPMELAVLANDSDANGSLDPSTVEIVSGPQNGQAVTNEDGTITYQPAEDFFGNDSFTYRVFDNQGEPSNVATVDVRVLASRLQNPNNPLDVNASSQVSPIDALLVINFLNRRGSNDAEPPTSGPPYYDVDGNGRIAPLDALRVINGLNRSSSPFGEGEALAAIDSDARLLSPGVETPAIRPAIDRKDPLEIADQEESEAELAQAFGAFHELQRDSLDELIDDLTKQRQQDDSDDDPTLALDAVWSDFGGLN